MPRIQESPNIPSNDGQTNVVVLSITIGRQKV